MTTTFVAFDPDEWETRALAFIRERHGATNVVRIPATDRGDAGIECYTYDGCAYQCYAPQEPLLTSARTNKIARKLTTDVDKFIDNRLLLQTIFGATKILHWILIVPRFDSKTLIVKCNQKRAKVDAASLPYVGSNFQVQLQAEADFTTERNQLAQRAALKSSIIVPQALDAEVQQWLTDKSDLAKTIEGKLQRGYPADTSERTSERLLRYVRALIESDNLKEKIREEMPQNHEELLRTIRSAEDILILTDEAEAQPAAKLRSELEGLQARIKNVAALSQPDVDRIATGAVADWLARCPLDWPASKSPP